MFGLGLPEILLILVVILLFVGPKKLPAIGASIGKALSEFKKAFSGEGASAGQDTGAAQEASVPRESAAAQVTAVKQETSPAQEPAAAPEPAGPPKPASPGGDDPGA